MYHLICIYVLHLLRLNLSILHPQRHLALLVYS